MKKIKTILLFSIITFLLIKTAKAEDFVSNQLLVQFEEEVFVLPNHQEEIFEISEIKFLDNEIKEIFNQAQVSSIKIQYNIKKVLKEAKKYYNDDEFKVLQNYHHQYLSRRYLIYFNKEDEIHDLKYQLDQHPLVRQVSYDKYNHALQNSPNDDLFFNQWSLDFIHAPLAWDIVTDASNIKLGIMDGGFQEDHPDLEANVFDFDSVVQHLEGNNGSDPTSPFELCNDHGTHVAGIAGAVGNNNLNVSGVFWTGRLNLVEIGTKFQNNSCYSSTSKQEDAIERLVSMGVRVINMSYGFDGWIVDNVQGNPSVIFVFSAGNSSLDADNIVDDNGDHYYVNFSDLNHSLLVGNSTEDPITGGVALSSNFGNNSVHLAAPGSSIINLLNPNSFGSKTGTSMAAPHVAGAVALAWSQCPNNLNAAQMRQKVLDTVQHSPAWVGLSISEGILDLNSLVRSVLETCLNFQDNDRDGFTVGEGDCDDNNANINPEAEDVCFDHIDNDCDGVRDPHCYDQMAIFVAHSLLIKRSQSRRDEVPDRDGDGIHDDVDNCIDIANADQVDRDQDSQGAACDCDDENDLITIDCIVCPFSSAYQFQTFPISYYYQFRKEIPESMYHVFMKHRFSLTQVMLFDKSILKSFTSLARRGSYYLKSRKEKVDDVFIEELDQFIKQLRKEGLKDLADSLNNYLPELKNRSFLEFLDIYRSETKKNSF